MSKKIVLRGKDAPDFLADANISDNDIVIAFIDSDGCVNRPLNEGPAAIVLTKNRNLKKQEWRYNNLTYKSQKFIRGHRGKSYSYTTTYEYHPDGTLFARTSISNEKGNPGTRQEIYKDAQGLVYIFDYDIEWNNVVRFLVNVNPTGKRATMEANHDVNLAVYSHLQAVPELGVVRSGYRIDRCDVNSQLHHTLDKPARYSIVSEPLPLEKFKKMLANIESYQHVDIHRSSMSYYTHGVNRTKEVEELMEVVDPIDHPVEFAIQARML